MLTKSFKIIVVSASFAGLLVACGKGMGEKNNRVIDGTYIEPEQKITSSGTKISQVADLSHMTNIVEIKDGIRTKYRVKYLLNTETGQQRGQVQITKDRLLIKGNSIVGVENIEDNCKDQSELGVHPESLRIGKNANGITLQGEDKKTVLKPYSESELKGLVEQIKAGSYDVGCFDITGSKFTKLDNEVNNVDAAPTTAEEDKAREEAKAEEEVTAKEKSEEALGISASKKEAAEASNEEVKFKKETQSTRVAEKKGTEANPAAARSKDLKKLN
jgi:hypothetical protein